MLASLPASTKAPYSVVSLLYVIENGAPAQIAVVGKEGLVDVAVFLGGESTISRAIVHSSGRAWSLSGPRLKTVFDRPRLEKMSCECYAVVKRETDWLLPGEK
jgi:hypothetical protein